MKDSDADIRRWLLEVNGKITDSGLVSMHDKYARRLLGVAMRQGISKEDAQEAVQDTFLRIAEHAGRIRSFDSPKSYMYKILINRVRDFQRSTKNRMASRMVQVDDIQIASVLKESDGQEHGFTECVEKVLYDFERRYPEAVLVFQLRVIEGFSVREVADAIERTYTATKEFVSRNCRKIKERIAQRCSEYDYTKPVESQL